MTDEEGERWLGGHPNPNQGYVVCPSGKQQHAEKSGAQAQAASLRAAGRNKARRSRSGPLTSYKCDFCGFWHVGHR